MQPFDTQQTDLPSRSDLEPRLHALRPRLLAFTLLHLNDSADAEDVVQETLSAAWAKFAQFRGDAKFETWVFGILRFKLLDAYRHRSRIQSFEFNEQQLAETDLLFRQDHHWDESHSPQPWSNPESQLETDHFWQIFDICVYQLPSQSARVFTLRELLGLETEQICDSLAISQQNCWTILHRARLKLRACLEKSWFMDGKTRQ